VDFKARVDAVIAENEGNAASFSGADWCELRPEEEFVFAIDPARFPRMVAAWSLYEVFMDLVDAEVFTLDPATVEHERKNRPDILDQGVSTAGFQQFAKAYAGMTFREAHAMFTKHDFWLTRQGTTSYSDEQ